MRTDFASFADFLTAASGISQYSARHSYSSRGSAVSSWTAHATFSDAMRFAREGWPEGRAAIEAARAYFSQIVGSKVRRPQLAHSVAGFAPDVGAFLHNEPENMFHHEANEAEAVGKIVRFVVNGTASCGISGAQLIKRGAFLAALVDELESAGYSVELLLAFHSNAGGASTLQTIPVKSAGESVEIDRIAFCLAHPAMFRRLVFSVWEQDLPFMRVNHSGYGMCSEMPRAERGDVYVDSSDLRMIQDGNAVQYMRDVLAPLGITFDE